MGVYGSNLEYRHTRTGARQRGFGMVIRTKHQFSQGGAGALTGSGKFEFTPSLERLCLAVAKNKCELSLMFNAFFVNA